MPTDVLVEIGLSDDVIIAQITSAETTSLDTSVDI
jgi:hypothetical protein